jgi:gliding-associated putative ABC transporter substrate-binding component GldG
MARERQFYEYLLGKVVLRTVLLLGILTFGFLAVQNWVVRLDLTEDRRFSISPASHRIAASLKDPLTIRAYFSDRIPERIVPLQRQVFDILDEYEAHGNGKIKVERYDPLESTAAASDAQNYGVRPIQLRVLEATEASALQVYGSIVLIHGDRASEVINIAERYPEGYDGLSVLEYELSSAIWQLTNERPKVGLTGYLEKEGHGNPMMGMPQPRPEFQGLRTKLGDAFDVEEVDLDREAPPAPEKMPLLLVVRPREMTDVAIFRLDQYLMKGGRIVLLITQGTIEQAQWGEQIFTYEPFKTGLDGWLEHHGVRVPNEFVVHLASAVPIEVQAGVVETPLGHMKMVEPRPNWFWPLFAGEKALDRDNPAVQPLKVTTFWWPHPVDVLENKLGEKQATVLIRSHAGESWRWKDLRRIDRRKLSEDRDLPAPSDYVSSPVAVALEGTFTSYFADKPLPPSLASEGEEEGPAEEEEKEGAGEAKEEGPGNPEEKKKGPEVVKASVEPTQMIIVGNSFFACDLLIGPGGERAEERAPFALNLADWLARSPDLIALRAKRYTDRRLVDKAFEERLDEVAERAKRGDIDEEELTHIYRTAEEEQKARWKRSRWINILVPCFLIVLAGAIVWVVRAANRASPARIPPAVPPESLAGGGMDS